MNDYDRDFGVMCLVISPSMRYVIDSVKYPKDLWKRLDRAFGKHNEDHSINLERTPITSSSFLPSKFLASSLSSEVVKDEQIA